MTRYVVGVDELDILINSETESYSNFHQSLVSAKKELALYKKSLGYKIFKITISEIS